jgi:hypothetical protein
MKTYKRLQKARWLDLILSAGDGDRDGNGSSQISSELIEAVRTYSMKPKCSTRTSSYQIALPSNRFEPAYDTIQAAARQRDLDPSILD